MSALQKSCFGHEINFDDGGKQTSTMYDKKTISGKNGVGCKIWKKMVSINSIAHLDSGPCLRFLTILVKLVKTFMAPYPNFCASKPATLCIIRQQTFKTINYNVMKLCKIAEERSLWSLSPEIESIFRKTNLRVKGENHQLFIACASHPCRFQIERKKRTIWISFFFLYFRVSKRAVL